MGILLGSFAGQWIIDWLIALTRVVIASKPVFLTCTLPLIALRLFATREALMCLLEVLMLEGSAIGGLQVTTVRTGIKSYT